jgi:hypothetical protein
MRIILEMVEPKLQNDVVMDSKAISLIFDFGSRHAVL